MEVKNSQFKLVSILLVSFQTKEMKNNLLYDLLCFGLASYSVANLYIPLTYGSVWQEQEVIYLLLLTLWDPADHSTQH